MQEKITFKNSLGYTLSGVLHTPPNLPDKLGGLKPVVSNGQADSKPQHPAAVVLCHGFARKKENSLIEIIAQHLEVAGLVVLSFDLTGHGASEGEFTEATYSQWISDIEKAVDFMYEQGFKRVGLLGHSQSGACTLLQTAKDSRINALIGVAPVGYPSKIKEKFKPELIKNLFNSGTSVEYKRAAGNKLLYKNWFEDLEKHNVIAASKEVYKPTLIIHGSKDTTILPQDSQDIFDNLKADNSIKQRVELDGADHSFKGFYKQIAKLATKWFEKYLERDSQVIKAWLRYDDKYLLLRRSEAHKNYPGLWDGVGGFLEEGVTPRAQAIVEFKEELGLEEKDVTFVNQADEIVREDKGLDKVWHIHTVLFEAKTDKVRLDWEHTEYKWIKLDQIKNFKIIPGLEKGLKKVLE
jgi:alpha-beta hydrolase superfamily lysophospholipase/ADP-ribose pyrophosphatase YjhB (NUDIX family)